MLLPQMKLENCDLEAPNAIYSLILFYMSFVCHSYVLVCHSYVIRIISYVIRLYLYVICMSLVGTRISLVCQSYVLVCHPYVTRMYSYVIRMPLVCGFTMKLDIQDLEIRQYILKVLLNTKSELVQLWIFYKNRLKLTI